MCSVNGCGRTQHLHVNFVSSILQSEVWEEVVKDEKRGALEPFLSRLFPHLYFPQVGIILLIDYNTAHEVGKPLEMERFPKRKLRICQLWSTSGFLSWFQFITIYKKMLCIITTNIFMFQFFTYKVSRTTTKNSSTCTHTAVRQKGGH